MENPDVDQVVRCLSLALEYHVLSDRSVQSECKIYEIFDEEKFPLTKGVKLNIITPPKSEEIYDFLIAIFQAERLGAECGILCLAYIERIIAMTDLKLFPHNWRRVTLAALILASKVWEDQAVWNVDFLSVFEHVTVQDLLQLEKVILNLLQFNVSLKASLYAKYYFELRSLAEKTELQFSIEPLSKEDADKLETRSETTESTVRKDSEKYKLTRRNSETNMTVLKSPRVVLN
jgi:hypothetical protein